MFHNGFLSDEDVQRLTGAARPRRQLDWLEGEGIPCKRQGSRVVVCWAHVHAYMEGRPLAAYVEPDLTGVH